MRASGHDGIGPVFAKAIYLAQAKSEGDRVLGIITKP